MTEGGSIMTLTYYGSQKTFPHYNVMGVAKAALEATVRYLAASLGERGIRVHAISAGPIKTLAARGVADFAALLDAVTARAPLHRNIEQLEVGKVALFLASDLSSGMTGGVTFVDCGFNITGI
jgi:enoyl-[acyl-carrier protein] reductase I